MKYRINLVSEYFIMIYDLLIRDNNITYYNLLFSSTDRIFWKIGAISYESQ